jgi:hypothetical protein
MAALSAVPVASASAAECPGTVEGGGVVLCSEGHEQIGTFAFTGQQKAGTPMTVFHRETSENLVMTCGSAKLSKGSFIGESGGKLKISGLYIEYGECRVKEPISCVVKSSIIVDGGTGTGTGPGLGASLKNASEVKLVGDDNELQEENTRWTTYNVTSKSGETCPNTSERRVKGSATCMLPESTVEAVTHVVKCENKPEDDRLYDAGYHAEFELTAEVKLTSGKKWSLQKV